MKQSLIDIYKNSGGRITITYLPVDMKVNDEVEVFEIDIPDLRVIANELLRLADDEEG
jgi:hypothetical protein